jgi:amidase
MKPTWGLVPYTGIAPIDPSLDHTGPMTANVRDNARMLRAIAGPDGIDMRQAGVEASDYEAQLEGGVAGLRVGILREGFTVPSLRNAVSQCVRSAAERLAKLGADVTEVSVPAHAEVNALTMPLLIQGLYRTVLTDGGQGVGRPDVYLPEFAARMSRWREHTDDLSPILKMMTLAGATFERQAGSRYYQLAANQARRARAAYDRALAGVDALLMPTTPGTAPPIPGPDETILEHFMSASAATPNTMPFDVTHHPAISVPCGDVDGLPVGMMLVGRHWDEATLYRIAYAWEQQAG